MALPLYINLITAHQLSSGGAKPVLVDWAITPIKIKVKLRQTQFLGFNQWNCSIHGEDRIVPMQWVEWYCMSVEDAIHSFKQHQVEEFTISGQFPI